MIPANLRVPHHSWQSQDKEGVARVVEDMECVMWSNMDTSKRRTTERVIDESVIVNKEEQDQCAFCHKSKVRFLSSMTRRALTTFPSTCAVAAGR